MLLPSPEELKTALPLCYQHQEFVEHARKTIVSILNRSDPRLLLVVGPCSIHNVDEALEYASLLKTLSNEVADVFFIVMRAHCEKPRTSLGWKGLVCDPYLDGSYRIDEGLARARKLFLSLTDLQMPIACEFLEVPTSFYLADLVAWGSIGARTAASQPHRDMASGLPMPVGFKNGVDGNLQLAVNGILAARYPRSFLGITPQGRIARCDTPGNPHGHLVLRGSDTSSNYDMASIEKALHLLRKAHLPEQLLIDCSHDNSSLGAKDPSPAFFEALGQHVQSFDSPVMGLSFESNLKEGSQIPRSGYPLYYGTSVTDPCLGWEQTKEMIYRGSDLLASCIYASREV